MGPFKEPGPNWDQVPNLGPRRKYWTLLFKNIERYHFVHFVVFQATFGIMATNVLGVLLGWHYNSLVLGVIHCGFSLAAFIFLPASPYELVRRRQSANLEPLLRKLRGEQGTSIEQEASMIIRLLRSFY